MAGELPLPLPAPPQGREHILQRQHALDNARRQYQQHPHPATTAAQPEISSAQQHLQKEGMQHAAPFGSDYSPHSSLQFGPPSPTNDYPAASSAPGPGGHYDPPGAGYEQHNTRGGILPTHSPPTGYTNGSMQVHDSASSSRPRRAGGAPGDGEGRFAGGFDPYAGGEDKVAEKAREAGYGPGGGSALYAGAGMGPIVPPGQKQSRYASMIPEQKPPKNLMEHVAPLMRSEWFPLIAYTVLSLITRLAYIGRSPTVIWDEAHFGKFGSHYLKSEFYFDVHPPLGKMLVGLAGLLSGYNGHFEFKSGEHYPADVNYFGMRVILALFGVAMVPIAWATSGALGWDWRARHLLTVMVLCDNAWLVISRFILLDSMLLFFTFTTVHGLVMFHQHQKRPFSDIWWFWLTFTGLSIGCVASVKWVGLFVTALVGFYTIEDLWEKFGELQMPVRTYVRHWCARALCLIVVPVFVYMLCFKIHFMILSHSGPGDAQMSSLFQAHLRGNDFSDSPLEAAFGSRLTLKNMGYGGGLLHSHVQTYPVGSQQQQVTCYHYKDNNNEWIVTPKWDEPALPDENSTEPSRMLKNGDVIRLVHHATGRNLHSHPIPAPITKENYEVAGYGDATIGDSNDYWVVELVDDMNLGKPKPGMNIRSLTSRIRFRHQNLGCHLRAANAVLPQWGWKQVEVSCQKDSDPKDDHTYWNIESHWNEKLPKGNAKLYRSPFLRDFIHLNVAMMTSNNALIPDADKEDILASKPLDWPWLWNGLRMNSWADNSIKYYLVGNPAIWWGSSFSLFVFAGVLLWYLMRMQRRIADLSPADFNQFVYVGKIAGLGWFLHYLPFLMMGRVTYIHHYLPTLYFAVMMLAHLFDHFIFNPSTARYRSRASSRGISAPVSGGGQTRVPLSESTKNAVFVATLAVIVGTFWWFHGVSYGMAGSMKEHHWGLGWRKSWNIYDR